MRTPGCRESPADRTDSHFSGKIRADPGSEGAWPGPAPRRPSGGLGTPAGVRPGDGARAAQWEGLPGGWEKPCQVPTGKPPHGTGPGHTGVPNARPGAVADGRRPSAAGSGRTFASPPAPRACGGGHRVPACLLIDQGSKTHEISLRDLGTKTKQPRPKGPTGRHGCGRHDAVGLAAQQPEQPRVRRLRWGTASRPQNWGSVPPPGGGGGMPAPSLPRG